jgi:hypothetical protein
MSEGRTTVPAARRDLVAVTLDGATVIHRHGQLHALDPVATLVWRCCDGGATVDEIAADLAAAFGVPPERAREDVSAAVAELTRLDLLAGAPRWGSEPEVAVLADPPGSCASCAEREWSARTALRVGARVAVVGSGTTDVDALLRAVLADHVVPVPAGLAAEPPFLGITAPAGAAGRGPRPVFLVHRGEANVARSRSAVGAVRAAVAYLASFADLAPLGLAALDALAVVRDGRAMLVPQPDEPVRFGHELADRGVATADVPVAVVDAARREVVVGAPAFHVDAAAFGDDAPELAWGRYAITALGVAGVPSPARALLEFAPSRDDARDPGLAFAALVALAESVPVVDAVAPDAIARALGDRPGGPE